MKKILRKICVFLMVVFTSTVIGGVNPVYAELMITPMTVMIKDGERFALVTLVNSGKELRTYEMGLNYTRMREEGAMYDMLDKPVTDFDLGKHITFTPRRISLAPGASQKIRLAVRRPAEPIPPGDYRVHLVFSSVPNTPQRTGDLQPSDQSSQETGQNSEQNESRVRAGVSLYVGFSIPVILRVGKPDVSARFGDMTLSRTNAGQMQVNLPVYREGSDHSLLGELKLYGKDADGQDVEVGSIGNANIFPEINRRVFRMILAKPLTSGTSVRIVYKSLGKQGNIVFAEQSFPIQ